MAESLTHETCGGGGDASSDEASAEEEGVVDVASEQVSVSCDSWRRVRHPTICEEEEQAGAFASAPDDDDSDSVRSAGFHCRGSDYSPEYIEVEEPDEPVPTQDSCLQVSCTTTL